MLALALALATVAGAAKAGMDTLKNRKRWETSRLNFKLTGKNVPWLTWFGMKVDWSLFWACEDLNYHLYHKSPTDLRPRFWGADTVFIALMNGWHFCQWWFLNGFFLAAALSAVNPVMGLVWDTLAVLLWTKIAFQLTYWGLQRPS